MSHDISGLPQIKQAYEIGAPARAGEPLSLGDAWNIKRILLGVMPHHEAFEAYREVLNLGPHVRLKPRRLKGLLEAAKSNAVDLHILHEGGRRAICEPPEVIGPGVAPRIEGVSRTVVIACFGDAVVHSRSGVVELGSELLLDFQRDELDSVPIDLAYDPVVFDRNNYDVAAIVDDRPISNVRLERAWSLLGVFRGFGHWMIEVLAQFLAAHEIDSLEGVPLLIDAQMPPQHRESLELLGRGRFPIIEVPRWTRVQVGRLWIAANWFYSPYLPTTDQGLDPRHYAAPMHDMASSYRSAARILDQSLNTETSKDNIFLARPSASYRRIINMAEIESFLKSHGFSTIFPENHSFAEQMRIIRGARNIVIQNGSATLGLLLARPGTKACYLSHPALPWVSMPAQLLKELGVDMKIVIGPFEQKTAPYVDRSDYRIPLDRLNQTLEEWMDLAPAR
jgi:hypothetical protein